MSARVQENPTQQPGTAVVVHSSVIKAGDVVRIREGKHRQGLQMMQPLLGAIVRIKEVRPVAHVPYVCEGPQCHFYEDELVLVPPETPLSVWKKLDSGAIECDGRIVQPAPYRASPHIYPSHPPKPETKYWDISEMAHVVKEV